MEKLTEYSKLCNDSILSVLNVFFHFSFMVMEKQHFNDTWFFWPKDATVTNHSAKTEGEALIKFEVLTFFGFQ